jgi:hypothetical protein
MASAPDEPPSPTSTASPVTPKLNYPFADATGKIEVIHDHGKIDVEAEMRFYEALVAVRASFLIPSTSSHHVSY